MVHVWFYTPRTGLVRDYLRTDLPVTEAARPGEVRWVGAQPLPTGHEPTWYRWDGTQFVLRPRAEYDPRGAECEALRAVIDQAVLTPEMRMILARLLALLTP